MITIAFDYTKEINYVLYRAHQPICHELRLSNNSDNPLKNLTVLITGDYLVADMLKPTSLASIEPKQQIRIDGLNIPLDGNKLAQLTEAIDTSIGITIQKDNTIVKQASYPIHLQPFDQWFGMSNMPQSIAAFVTPNDPIINNVLVEAAQQLKATTGHSAFINYQSKDPNDVLKQVAAIYATLCRQNIVYRSIPASFEQNGQRVTLPHQVLTSKLGNCIELAVLYASVLEAAGIQSGIVFEDGHAYLAVWLVPPKGLYSIYDEPSILLHHTADGIHNMMVIECTTLTNEHANFEDAITQANINLSQHPFHAYIDIYRCRLEGYLPLPRRIERDGIMQFESEGVVHDQSNTNVTQRTTIDLSQLSDEKKLLTRFDIWERRLLDLSLRNPLLNVGKRALRLLFNAIDTLEDTLQDDKEIAIVERPEFIGIDFDNVFLHLNTQKQLCQIIDADFQQKTLHTLLTPSDTTTTLKRLYRTARESAEETGANTLFLSLGSVEWYESDVSVMPRYAPILLLPVKLVYKLGHYYIRTREEEITLNITLMEMLRQEFNITINGLQPLPKDEHGVDVRLVLTAIREAIAQQKRWAVHDVAMLGNFSFSKFVMWNDLHSHREAMMENNVISSFVAQKLTWRPSPITSNLSCIDANVDPSQIALPVSVDSSQMAAVIEGGKGNTFILYGPPGTGKSQTITNLIANALFHGKRVLFVAEKMAALTVVQRRLAQIGLDPFCLELHSNKSTKHHVLEQLSKALDVAHIASPQTFAKTATLLFEERKKLIAYIKALHNVDPITQLSLYDYFVRYESIVAEPLENFQMTEALKTTVKNDGITVLEEILGDQLNTIVTLVGVPAKHPMNGLRLPKEALQNTESFQHYYNTPAETLRNAVERVAELSTTKEIYDEITVVGNGQFLTKDVEQLQQDWDKANTKRFLFKHFAIKRVLKDMQTYNPNLRLNDIPTLLDKLKAYKTLHQETEQIRKVLRDYFNVDQPKDSVPCRDTLQQYIEKLNYWASLSKYLRDWRNWLIYRTELCNLGLTCIVDTLEHNENVDITNLQQSFFKAYYRFLAEQTIESEPTLATFEGMLFDNHVKKYKQLTEEFQQLTKKYLYAQLASQVPQASNMTSNSSEIGYLRRNINNNARGISLRELFRKIPTLLPHLCPCMLMSPISVAQYLDLQSDKFDLVIFDEASQMPTSEAVGAIARGKALIVVGDPKQMPPTSFFSSGNVDEEDADIDDLESILEDCRSLEIPSLQLSWHYRSRHESLITFSNNEYYNGTLITFPSTDDQKAHVSLRPVKGCYDKGKQRTNRKEAEAIVEEVVRRLNDEELRIHSIGIIAFSVAQQRLIEDLLQERFDKNKDLRELANNMYEPLFVKNLENVQGDERDIILFSIGYGPDKDGKVSMNFGPLNVAGGERRLNVAVSRAREEMIVFSTLSSTQIDLKRTQSRGVEGLKHFLEFAETQSITFNNSTQRKNDVNIIAQEIGKALKQHLLITHIGVGQSNFKVDIAISRPETPEIYELGILLDGKNYRDTQTTRDREIVQPSVLESLHWRVMRVWSVDWFNNRERVIKRILDQINNITTQPEEKQALQTFDITSEPIVETISRCHNYEIFHISKEEAVNSNLLVLAQNIVTAEQPISLNTLCRRICQLRETGKVTAKLQRDMLDCISNVLHITPDKNAKYTIWLAANDEKNGNYYRLATDRDITEIPISELCNAIIETLEEQIAIPAEALTLIAAKKIGFARRGEKVDNALNLAINELMEKDIIEAHDNRLRMKK
ncbi:MAG: DUF4011 domain-containing protein [Bacteroidales bacterium]|nr:DUF4011 domain-containing protein [Bacteroidales bacterium]